MSFIMKDAETGNYLCQPLGTPNIEGITFVLVTTPSEATIFPRKPHPLSQEGEEQWGNCLITSVLEKKAEPKQVVGVTGDLVTYLGYAVEINDNQCEKAHVTVAYGNVQATSRLRLSNMPSIACHVVDVVYWDKLDLTVIIVGNKNNMLHTVREKLEGAGFTYDHQFEPHITVGKGNIVDVVKAMLGNSPAIFLSNPFIQIKERK